VIGSVPLVPAQAGTQPFSNPDSRFRGNEWKEVPALQLGDDAAVVASILGGAHIVRVHDVAGVLPAVRIADAMLTASRRAE